MTTNNKIAQPASTNLTLGLASLGTSSTWVAGRESTSVLNTTNLYFDYLLSGHVKVGTTPTANTVIEVWVVAKEDDSNWPDVFDGTDSAETATTRDVLLGFAKLAASLSVDTNTTGRVYSMPNVSIRQLFGELPKEFVVFVTHNTGVNTDSTAGSHVFSVTGVYSTSGG